MNGFNRVFVSLVALVAVGVGVLMLLAVSGAMSPEAVGWAWLASQLDATATSEGVAMGINIIIALGLIIVGLVLLFLEIVWPIMTAPKMILLSRTAEGSVTIVLDSVRELAERTVRDNPGVEGASCEVDPDTEGMRVKCRVGLYEGSDIPEVTSQIQHSVKRELEESVGIAVSNVEVMAKYVSEGGRLIVAR